MKREYIGRVDDIEVTCRCHFAVFTASENRHSFPELKTETAAKNQDFDCLSAYGSLATRLRLLFQQLNVNAGDRTL